MDHLHLYASFLLNNIQNHSPSPTTTTRDPCSKCPWKPFLACTFGPLNWLIWVVMNIQLGERGPVVVMLHNGQQWHWRQKTEEGTCENHPNEPLWACGSVWLEGFIQRHPGMWPHPISIHRSQVGRHSATSLGTAFCMSRRKQYIHLRSFNTGAFISSTWYTAVSHLLPFYLLIRAHWNLSSWAQTIFCYFCWVRLASLWS